MPAGAKTKTMRFHESNDFISVFLWAVFLSVLFFLARPVMGFAVIMCCMFFTFYLFSDVGNKRSPI
jgi:hypothetical protein